MFTIPAPHKATYIALGENHGKFEIGGCYPGYGTTLGNALRRVLLSSLDGAAAISVRIKNVSHEFSAIDGVMEDVVQILLNLKQIRFRLHQDEPVIVTLKAKGECVVTAAAIKASSAIEVVNPDLVIATLTDKKAELEMEIEVGRGIGYVPVEQREEEERPIGTIALDSIYTPIKRVNYDIENMRVGKRTDYDKITLEVVTDGTVTPEAAFAKAVDILVNQFVTIQEKDEAGAEKEKIAAETLAVEDTPVMTPVKKVKKAKKEAVKDDTK